MSRMVEGLVTDVAPVRPPAAPLARSPFVWGGLAVALLSFVYLAGMLGLGLATGLASPDGDVATRQTALVLYARIVLPKVLLPHAVVTLALYAIAERSTALSRLGHWPRRGAFVVMALGVAALLAAFWLPSDAFGLARVNTRGPGNFAATCIEISVATTAAALAARWLLDTLARRRSTPRP